MYFFFKFSFFNIPFSLKETDPVVEFSQDKLMKVNYPSRLITLISEVRQLKAMGYHIPSTIEETSEHAKKFMKYARLLEQVCPLQKSCSLSIPK